MVPSHRAATGRHKIYKRHKHTYVPRDTHTLAEEESREDRRGITGGSTGGRGGGVDLGAGRGGGGGDAEADPAGRRGGALASASPPLAPLTPIRPARRAPDAHTYLLQTAK